MQWRAHSAKQEAAVFSDKKILAALTGIQFGKTTIGAIRMKVAMHRCTDPEDAFIIAAPTYKIMQQSTLPAFLRLMVGLGTYSKSDGVFTTRWGTKCYMRTATEPDSIVGITNVRHIWVDEAGKVSLYFWENVQARSAFRDCPIDLTSSPYTLNWLFKEIVRPKQKDKAALAHADLVQAASWENPYMPAGMIEHARQTMDARRFNALFGGKWERMAGLVYDCFDEIENQVEASALPDGTRYVGGIDWGYTEPFVLKVRGITPTGQHYGVSEFYKSGLTINGIAPVVIQMARIHGMTHIYAGPDQPGYIEELNRLLRAANVRCVVVASDNDVRVGIDRHYELLKTRRLRYFRGTHPYTLDEYDTYHYPAPEDLQPDEDAKDAKPVFQNDHALDADRYISISTTLASKRYQAAVADDKPREESQFQRIERLKRRARVHGEEVS
jgi:hypothetical protein